MSEIEYYCEGCGRVHGPGEARGTGPDLDWPVLNAALPDVCTGMSLHDLATRLELTEDLCVVHAFGGDRCFVHLHLEIPLQDASGALVYGPWVEIDGESFDELIDPRYEPERARTYAGELASTIPGYDGLARTDAFGQATGGLPMRIYPHGVVRPTLAPDRSVSHPLVTDFYSGITREEAELRIRSTLMAVQEL